MRVFDAVSHYLRRIGFVIVTLLLCATPALAGSWSTTMAVSATVVSSCTLSFDPGATTPRIRSACTRGEQARISLLKARALAAPLPQIAEIPGPGATKVVLVTY